MSKFESKRIQVVEICMESPTIDPKEPSLSHDIGVHEHILKLEAGTSNYRRGGKS